LRRSLLSTQTEYLWRTSTRQEFKSSDKWNRGPRNYVPAYSMLNREKEKDSDLQEFLPATRCCCCPGLACCRECTYCAFGSSRCESILGIFPLTRSVGVGQPLDDHHAPQPYVPISAHFQAVVVHPLQAGRVQKEHKAHRLLGRVCDLQIPGGGTGYRETGTKGECTLHQLMACVSSRAAEGCQDKHSCIPPETVWLCCKDKERGHDPAGSLVPGRCRGPDQVLTPGPLRSVNLVEVAKERGHNGNAAL